jgi:UDP-glucose 4-epimerase
MAGVGFLITGGNGFIGSHTVVELFQFLSSSFSEDFRIIIIDNYSNSSHDVMERVHKVINNPISHEKIFIYEESVDIRN